MNLLAMFSSREHTIFAAPMFTHALYSVSACTMRCSGGNEVAPGAKENPALLCDPTGTMRIPDSSIHETVSRKML
jgi:hypothetical protein